MTPRLSAPTSIRERSSYSQAFLSPIGSSSLTDFTMMDGCMNYPETIVQPRISNSTGDGFENETFDEDLECMKGHAYKESFYRERNDNGMGDRFVSKKRTPESCI